MNSASQAISPPTSATPENFQTLPPGLPRRVVRHPQNVAGDHHAAELAAVDGHEIDQHVAVLHPEVDADHDGGGLGHGLDNGDAGHDRLSGEMAQEMRFVHGDVLDAERGLIAVDLLDAVDQKKGIAMRDDPLDQRDVRCLQGVAHGPSFPFRLGSVG